MDKIILQHDRIDYINNNTLHDCAWYYQSKRNKYLIFLKINILLLDSRIYSATISVTNLDANPQSKPKINKLTNK